MACSIRSAIAGTARVPVSINGVAIPHDLISREAQNHPAPTPVGAWQSAARALAVRELLLQEARRLALRAEPAADADGRRETEEEALVRALVEGQVATPGPDEASCRRYYDKNAGRFRSPEICEASHILLAARRDQPAAYTAARERALSLLARLAEKPELFVELAVVHSDCPSAKSGGNLGQLTSGATTPEFEKAMAALAPGEISKSPVETRYGFHIMRLERRIAGKALPFEVVRERIAGYLAERSRRLAIAQYVARLAAGAEIGGIDLPTPESLRVH
jgi:peptidyl-prolyl cis-trans isomerase C